MSNSPAANAPFSVLSGAISINQWRQAHGLPPLPMTSPLAVPPAPDQVEGEVKFSPALSLAIIAGGALLAWAGICWVASSL